MALILSVVMLVIAVLVGWAFASPYLFPNSVRSAAERGDRERLEELIDFPRVKDGLKTDLKAIMTAGMQQEMAGAGEEDAFTAGLGQLAVGMVGMAMDNMVDQVVSPAGLENIATGRPTKVTVMGQSSDPMANAFPKDASGERFRLEKRYLSFDRFRYSVVNDQKKSRFDIDMRRKGLFGWQVTRVTPRVDLNAFKEPEMKKEKAHDVPSVGQDATIAEPLTSMAYTPEKGSVERAALMESLRLEVASELGQDIAFVIRDLKVHSDWAFAVVEPVHKDGSALEATSTPIGQQEGAENLDGLRTEAIWRRADGQWRVEAHAVGATDVWYEPYCHTAPAGLIDTCPR